MRGFEDTSIKKPDMGCNCVLTWGCPPSSGVPAKSSIVTSYTEQVARKMKKGVVVFPEALIGYSGTDGKAETLPKCKAFLWLDCTVNNTTNVTKTNVQERLGLAFK